MKKLTVQELRIGNILKYGDGEIIVDINILRDINMYNICGIESIPLTEEWLLKFGFKKSNLDKDNAWLNLKYRYLNFYSDESVKFKKVYLNVNKMDVICDSVHQLQNLHFALTGLELEIK